MRFFCSVETLWLNDVAWLYLEPTVVCVFV